MKTNVMNTLPNSENIQGNAKTNNLSSYDFNENLFSLFSDNSLFETDHPCNLYNYNTMNIKPSLEDKKPLLLNLDTPRIRRNSIIDSESEEKLPRCKSLPFDSDEEEDGDTEAWVNKAKELWDKTDTVYWLLWVGIKLGQTYDQMSPHFAMPGKDLLRLSKDDFLIRDPVFGGKIYDLLHEKRELKICLSSFDALKLAPGDETSPKSESKTSDGESLKNSKDNNQTKRRGRPARLVPKKKIARLKLWEFIRKLLHDPEYCPKLICWENYEEKTFRFNQNRLIAQLWGKRNNETNEKMNYEKFARAIRYYYKKQIFEIVPGRRLVYKFGKKATGLETNCPNFDPNYGNKVNS